MFLDFMDGAGVVFRNIVWHVIRLDYDTPGAAQDGSLRQTITLAEEFLHLLIIIVGEYKCVMYTYVTKTMKCSFSVANLGSVLAFLVVTTCFPQLILMFSGGSYLLPSVDIDVFWW